MNEINVGFNVYVNNLFINNYSYDKNMQILSIQNASYYWLDGNNTNIYNFNGFTNELDPLILDNYCNQIEFCLYHVTPSLNIG